MTEKSDYQISEIDVGFQGAEDPGLVVLMVLMLMVILVGWEL